MNSGKMFWAYFNSFYLNTGTITSTRADYIHRQSVNNSCMYQSILIICSAKIKYVWYWVNWVGTYEQTHKYWWQTYKLCLWILIRYIALYPKLLLSCIKCTAKSRQNKVLWVKNTFIFKSIQYLAKQSQHFADIDIFYFILFNKMPSRKTTSHKSKL